MLHEAIGQWGKILGADAVKSDDVTVDRYARTTAPRGTAPAAVLWPQRTEQVQQIVRIAVRFRVPLYPISRGRNWGYGDACAPQDGQVIIDLRRMNRIVELNRELAYAVIEPGVSQQQLHDHLESSGNDLWMDATGAGPDASVVGNTLERGFGHTPCGDHFANTCGMRIVLADASVLDTGFGHVPGAHATYCYPYGIGPGLDGLFCQSNLGIVTRVGVWLNRRPQAMRAVFASTSSDDDLVDLIDRLRELRLAGLLRSAVHVANDLRLLSSRVDAATSRPLSPGDRQRLRKVHGVGAWNVSSAIYGTRTTVAAAGLQVKKTLRSYRVVSLNDAKLRRAKRAGALLGLFGMGANLRALISVVEPAFEMLKGRPVDAFVRDILPHATCPSESGSLDPLDYHTGLIWVSPVAPAQGDHARRLIQLMEPIYNRFGFDLPVTFTLVTERALSAVTNISFNRRDCEQTERAAACYDELMRTLMDAGYPPYRTGPAGFKRIRTDSPFWHAAQRIKHALDPHGIISPGRYLD